MAFIYSYFFEKQKLGLQQELRLRLTLEEISQIDILQDLVELAREKQEEYSENGTTETATYRNTETAASRANGINVLIGLASAVKQTVIGFKTYMEDIEKGVLPFIEEEAEQAIEKFQEDIHQLRQRQKSVYENQCMGMLYITDPISIYHNEEAQNALLESQQLVEALREKQEKHSTIGNTETATSLVKQKALVEKLENLSMLGYHREDAQKAISQSQQLVEVLREKQEKYSTNGDTETAASLAKEIEALQGLARSLKHKDIWYKKCQEFFTKSNFMLENAIKQTTEKLREDTLQLNQRQKTLVEKLDILNIIGYHREEAQNAIMESKQLVKVLREEQEKHSTNGDTETATFLGKEIEKLQESALTLKQKEIWYINCLGHFEKEDFRFFVKEATQTIEIFQEGTLEFNRLQKSLVEKLEVLHRSSKIYDYYREDAQKAISQSQQLVEVLREKQEKYSTNGDTETAASLVKEIEALQGLALTLKHKDIWYKKCQELFEKGGFPLIEKEATQAIDLFYQRQKALVEKLETLGIIEKIQMGKQKFLENVDKKLGEDILNTIIKPSNPFTVGQRQGTGVKFADIEGNDKAKKALQEALIYPMLNPELYSGIRAPSKGVLLYGSPGNGKTMIAKAAAEEAKCVFFNISSATIMTKCHTFAGEIMVQTLFQMARNAQPSIIFLDEIDSMLCERSKNEDDSARRVKTAFLAQMEGCASQSDDKFLMLGATNRPQEIDDGILRRFPQRIFIDLPNAAARRSFIVNTFQKHNAAYQMTNSELDELANMTEGYSYSDLRHVCKEAAMEPLNEIDTSELLTTTPDMLRPINYQDLITAIQSINPSTNMENRRKLQEFASGGDRKGLK